MRKFTLFLLFLFIGFSTVFAQSRHKADRTGVLRKVFLQNQLNLRSDISDFYGNADSTIIRMANGDRIAKLIFNFTPDKDTIEEYEWDAQTQSWEYPSKSERYYNNSGDEIEFIDYSGENGSWVPVYRTTYKYSAPGILTDEYGYDYENGQWVVYDSVKVETTVTPTSKSEVFHRYVNNAWEKSLKEDYLYDGTGKELSNGYSTWSTEKNKWVPVSRESSEYAADGKLKVYYDENWDEDTQTWYPDEEKFIFNYDSKGQLATMDAYEVDEATGTWDMSAWTYQYVFYYDGYPAGINRISPANLNIWSCQKTIRIEGESALSSVRIYNVSGNLLYAKQLGGTQVFITDLPLASGVYIVQAGTVQGQSTVTKVMLR